MPHRVFIAKHKILAQAPAGQEGHVVCHAQDGSRRVARLSELPILISLAGLTSMLFGFILGVLGSWTGFAVLGGLGLTLVLAISLFWLSRWQLLSVAEAERPNETGDVNAIAESTASETRRTPGSNLRMAQHPDLLAPDGGFFVPQTHSRPGVAAERLSGPLS